MTFFFLFLFLSSVTLSPFSFLVRVKISWGKLDFDSYEIFFSSLVLIEKKTFSYDLWFIRLSLFPSFFF